jgi:hypothetical protein
VCHESCPAPVIRVSVLCGALSSIMIEYMSSSAASTAAARANIPRSCRASAASVHAAVTQLREHDDREQFLVGVDIFLTGIAALE